MKTIVESILYIVYRNIGHGVFTALLLNRWIKYALKGEGYNVSDVNLVYELGNRYQGTLKYIENGIENQQIFRIIYDGVNINVVDLGTNTLTQEERIVDRYIREAEKGDAEAQYKLGVCYYNGEGVNQDFTEAAKWFRMAAEQGDAEAQYNLGVCYNNGEGVNQDFTEAAKWIRMAAEQGIADAQYDLGVCYNNGEGVNQDFTEAAKWFRMAAEQGDAEAQNSLKRALSKAKKQEAVKSMKASLEQGKDDDTLLKLGLVYYSGYGVEKNQQLAQKYFKEAAELGNKMAQLIIDGNDDAIALLKKWEDSDDMP